MLSIEKIVLSDFIYCNFVILLGVIKEYGDLLEEF